MEMIPAPRTAPAELTVALVWAWLRELTAVGRRLSAQLPRWDTRRRAGAYLRGLRSPVERTNGGPLAAVHGDATAEAVRDAWRDSVLEPRGPPEGILGIDETGLLKQGRHAAGVARP